MKNALRQQQLFSDERPVWESLPDELRPTIQQLLSLLLEQELTSSITLQSRKEEQNHV